MNDMYEHVKEYIAKAWGVRDRFPGPQPVSIELKHFPILRNNDYVVCEKTDGMRYMMVAMTYQGKRHCVFVNRNFEMFEAPINFRRKIFDGTILDGELYENQFLVYDALTIDGYPVGHLDFLSRLEKIESAVKSIISMKSDRIKVRLKTFHALTDFKTFMDDYLPTVQEKIDGLVFTPIKDPVKIGTHETMFKWKPKEKNTVDFLVRRDDQGTWRLYVQEKGKLFMESTLPPVDIPWLRDEMIVECEFMENDIPMWWRPIMERKDKTYPNNRRTFYRTIVNIREDIKMEDFLKCT
jgi:hypothetical protein